MLCQLVPVHVEQSTSFGTASFYLTSQDNLVNEAPRQTKSGIGQPVAHYHRLHFLFSLFSHFSCRRPRPPTLSPSPQERGPFPLPFVCVREGEEGSKLLDVLFVFLPPFFLPGSLSRPEAMPEQFQGEEECLGCPWLRPTERGRKAACLLGPPTTILFSLPSQGILFPHWGLNRGKNIRKKMMPPPLPHLPRHKPCARELKDPATLSQQLATIIVLRSEQRSVPKYEGLNVATAAKPPSPFVVPHAIQIMCIV